MALDALIDRKRPSWIQRLLSTPYAVIAEALYAKRQQIAARASPLRLPLGISVVCVSDTHNSTPELPDGDVLVHAGDLTQGGSPDEVQAQLDWLDRQPHKYKIVIAGNHDIALDSKVAAQHNLGRFSGDSLRWGSIVYLEKSATSLKLPGSRSLSVFGHPSTRKNGNWAFQHDRDTDVFTSRVKDDADILMTHSPPQFHLDGKEMGWGDKHLLRELWRVKPRLDVFGHIHESHGKDCLIYDSFERHYERVRDGSAGLWSLIQMALLVLQMLIVPGLSRQTQQTMLVNAAVVEGMNDAGRRAVQVIHI